MVKKFIHNSKGKNFNEPLKQSKQEAEGFLFLIRLTQFDSKYCSAGLY